MILIIIDHLHISEYDFKIIRFTGVIYLSKRSHFMQIVFIFGTICKFSIYNKMILRFLRGRRGRDRTVVGFTTSSAFSACHH